MTEVTDIDVMFPDGKYVELEIDGEVQKQYIAPFKLGKTLRVLDGVAQLTSKADLASLFAVANKGEQSFISTLLDRAPDMISEGHPYIPRVCAMALMPNERYKEVDLNGEDFEAALKPFRAIVLDMDIEQTMKVLALAIDGMKLDQIRKNFPMLLKRLGSL